MKTVSMIGMGALGILFGQPLSKTLGADFRIVADEARINRYKSMPVTANGEVCDFNFIAPNADVAPADLVIIAVKSTVLEQAIADIESQIGENTVIISLLNGTSSEEILSKRWANQVVYAIAVGMDATRVGQSLVYQNMGKIQIGEADGSISPRINAMAELFTKSGVPFEVCENILHLLWSKMIVNVGVNQATAVFDVPYRVINSDSKARETAILAMREVVAIANAKGIALTEADIEQWLALLATLNPEGMPSMRQDFLAKRPMEIELFSGTICRLGREFGVPTPVNDWFYEKLNEIESNY